MFDQARSLESAMKSSESYTGSQPSFNSAVPDSPSASVLSQSENLDPNSLLPLCSTRVVYLVFFVETVGTLAQNARLGMLFV